MEKPSRPLIWLAGDPRIQRPRRQHAAGLRHAKPQREAELDSTDVRLVSGARTPLSATGALIAESRFQEICCMCGDQTQSGIYVGRDPDRVPFPAVVAEWDGE